MRRRIEHLKPDDKRLIVLRSVLAYALREVHALEKPPFAAIDAIALAYKKLDEAAVDAVGPLILDAVTRDEQSDLH